MLTRDVMILFCKIEYNQSQGMFMVGIFRAFSAVCNCVLAQVVLSVSLQAKQLGQLYDRLIFIKGRHIHR